MELHAGRPQDFNPIDLTTCTLQQLYHHAYTYATDYHEKQLDFYRAVSIADLTPEKFWSEYIWCVYVSGFRASVVTKHYAKLCKLYGAWNVDRDFEADWLSVSKLIANRRKFDAIVKCRKEMLSFGWEKFKEQRLRNIASMLALPFIGEVTMHHLGRNLGFDTVKPDLHLWRLALQFKFKSPWELCTYLKNEYGERVGVVDFILWSYCAAFGTSEIQRGAVL